eukprot:c13927_g1_i2 orf=456-1460(+)
MKQQKSEEKTWKTQKMCTEFGTTDIRFSRRRLLKNSDEYRRKTRSEVLREKQARAVNTSLGYSEVSIQTLHSICTPAAAHQAKKSLQRQQPSKSTAQHNELGAAPFGLLSSSKRYLFYTSEAHPPEESRLQVESSKGGAEATESPQPSNVSAVDTLPLQDRWLEIFVEIDDGIDLVVDLDSDSTTNWFLERNSCMLVHPDVADDSLKQCGTNSNANDNSDVACIDSINTEAPSTNTTASNDRLTTICIAVDRDAGSETAQLGILAGCAPSCKLAEVVDSQDSSTSEVKELRNQGFNFATLEGMPTFLVTGMTRPSVEESKVTCNSNWMVACIEA